MRGKPFIVRLMAGGLVKPNHQILGSDISGRVEAVGRQVTQLHPADKVIGAKGVGGFAEYAGATEGRLTLEASQPVV